MADSGLSVPPSPPPSFTSLSARSLCFCRPQERRGGCHCDRHFVITSYCLSSLVAVPLFFRPPISPPPPPPLPLLELLIVASHPLPLLSFLIVVSHLVVGVCHLVVVSSSSSSRQRLLFVKGSDGPSCVTSTYSHFADAAGEKSICHQIYLHHLACT